MTGAIVNRPDAIKALLRGGKQAELADVIQRRSDTAQQTYARIRDDAGRSEEHKRWALAVATNQARLGLEQELASMASRVISTDRDDAERVFGIKGLDGDPASLVISRRDAADRVARVESPDELRDLLTRATRSGDEVLARAVAERAVEMQDDTTMHQFLGDRPSLDAAGERLWNAERSSANSMMVSVQLAELRPQEYALASFEQVEMTAMEPEPGSTTAAV